MKIKEELIDLELNLSKLNAPVIKLLNPPASEAEIFDFYRTYFPAIKVSEEIKSIYLWHNGTVIDNISPARKFYMFADFYLDSLSQIEKNIKADDELFHFLDKGLLPLFSSGQGENLAINIQDFDPEKTPLLWVGTSNPEIELYTTIYDSFHSMMATIKECFKRNVYFIDNKGLMDYDFDNYYNISKSMNPNSDYWN